jgi:hypothetical protein
VPKVGRPWLACRSSERSAFSRTGSAARLTYSTFTGTGNLVDAFDDRDAAVAALTRIVRAEPASADEVFLVAQDDEGHVGETIYGSSLHVTA